MPKRPWFKLYPSDFLHGIRRLPPLEIAVFCVCIFEMYDADDGWIQFDIEAIALGCNMRKDRCAKIVDSLVRRDKFIVSDGLMSNKRVQKEFGNCAEIAQTAARNARKRWADKPENANENNGAVMRAHSGADAKDHADGMLTRSQIPDTRVDANASTARARDPVRPSGNSIQAFDLGDAIPPWPPGAWEVWYGAYPHKVGKDAAQRAFEKRRKNPPCIFADLMAGLERYKRTKPPDRNWCNPATWLNEGRWNDAPAAAVNGRPSHTDALRRATQEVLDRDDRNSRQANPRHPDQPARGYLPPHEPH